MKITCLKLGLLCIWLLASQGASGQFTLDLNASAGPCLYNENKGSLDGASFSYCLGMRSTIKTHTLAYSVRYEQLDRKIDGKYFGSNALYHQGEIGRIIRLDSLNQLNLSFLFGISFNHKISSAYQQSSENVYYTSGKFGVSCYYDHRFSRTLDFSIGGIYGIQESFFFPPAHHLYHSFILSVGIRKRIINR